MWSCQETVHSILIFAITVFMIATFIFIWSTRQELLDICGLGVMVFNATNNNNSIISWQSVLLVEETGVPGENH
jgi:hypothetical protein